MEEAGIIDMLLSSNSIVLIVLGVISVFGGKFYATYSKNQREKSEKFLSVIERNTEAITKLDTHIVYENNDNQKSFVRVHERLDQIVSSIAENILKIK